VHEVQQDGHMLQQVSPQQPLLQQVLVAQQDAGVEGAATGF
jgi:hypothetical protein